MKRYSIILLSAVLAIGACSKENTDKDISEMYPVFSTKIENIETRTTLGEDHSVLWAKDDYVAVFNEKTTLLKYKAREGGSSETHLEAVSSAGGEGSALSANVAFYPYSDAVTCTETSGTFTLSTSLPASQTYSPESFGVNASPMIAVTAGASVPTFNFKNVFGLLKLQFTGNQTIKRISVKGNNGEPMAGSLSVSMKAGGDPTYVFGSDASLSISLDCGDGVTLNGSTPTPFYISVPCREYSNGITVSVEVADASVTIPDISTTGAVTVGRSAIQPMTPCKIVGVETQVMKESDFQIKFCNSCYAYAASNKGVESGTEADTTFADIGATKIRKYDHTNIWGQFAIFSPKLLLRGTSSGWTSLHGNTGTLCQPKTDNAESGFDDYDYDFKDYHSFGGRRRQVAIVVDMKEACNVASVGLVNWNRTGADGQPKGHLKGVEFYVSNDPDFSFTPAYGSYKASYDYSNYANPNENNWTLIAKTDNLAVSSNKDEFQWVDVPYSLLVSGKAKGRFLKIRFLTNTGIDGATGYSARELSVKKATNLD